MTHVRSAAAAFAWEFRRRHRWGIVALVLYCVVMAVLKYRMASTGGYTMRDGETFAMFIAVPLSFVFLYVIGAFTFGFSGDLAARQSVFPARLFTLPVTTEQLVRWPMFIGGATMAVLWVAIRFLSVWPSDVPVPVLWPVVMAMLLLWWAQALLWLPYPVRGARVVVTLLWLAAMETIMFVALHFQASERVMIAIIAPQLPFAYLLARAAVARARRGDVPTWRIRVVTSTPKRRVPAFKTAAAAQRWFEWKRHGLTLPTWVAFLLPAELVILWAAGTSATLVLVVLLGVLVTPPVMAGFTGAALRPSNPDARDALGVPPFIATRPVTSAALIGAKLKATLWSTALTWLLVIAASLIALQWSGTSAIAAERLRRLAAVVGAPRAYVFVALVIGAAVVSTWNQLVQNLWVGLGGRAWVVRTSLVVALLLASAIGPGLVWIAEDRRIQVFLWNEVSLILGVLVGLKMIAVAWVAARLTRNPVLNDRTLFVGAATWVAAVLLLFWVLAWMLDTPHIPRHALMLVAILLVPLARVSASPLALAWNRHR